MCDLEALVLGSIQYAVLIGARRDNKVVFPYAVRIVPSIVLRRQPSMCGKL
jgi:hypothetical protein